jgi:hypothetical protein
MANSSFRRFWRKSPYNFKGATSIPHGHASRKARRQSAYALWRAINGK